MSETTKIVPMSLVIPEWLGAGAVIDLGGRQLTFRQRRFQDGTTVYDCVDAEGCLRTVTRREMATARMIRDLSADARQLLANRCQDAADRLAFDGAGVRGVRMEAVAVLREVVAYLSKL